MNRNQNSKKLLKKNNGEVSMGKEEEAGGGERGPLAPVSEDGEDAEDVEDEDEGITMFELLEVGAPATPDGGWGWVIVFASFMCNMIVDGIAYTFGVFLPLFAASFNEGKGKTAWAGSLLSGVYLSVGPIVSALTNKYGCRAVCIAGSIVGSIGFALSSLSPNLDTLMITYGVIGGIGFGLVYLPAVVCVGYYFERKRALATGIAVCGSGVGTFVFAPFATWLLTVTDWRKANLVFSALILCCSLFGSLMKPLEVLRDTEEEDLEEAEKEPLLLRMAEDKKNYLEKGSFSGSAYFMVQLPDGTMERRLKLPLNVDPGVHSSFNLDQLVPGSPITPVPTIVTLPTITEAKAPDGTSNAGSENSREGSAGELKTEKGSPEEPTVPGPILEESENSDLTPDSPDADEKAKARAEFRRIMRERRNSEGVVSTPSSSTSPTPSSSMKPELFGRSPSRPIPLRSGSIATPGQRIGSIPRNGSAPQFTPGRSIPKNGSVPLFDRYRKQSYRAVPIGMSANRPGGSKSNLSEGRRGSMLKNASFASSIRNNNGGGEEESLWSGELNEGLFLSVSHRRESEQRQIIRPLSRKDIFYSGSIANLPEFQSQRSLPSYRQSILNIPPLFEETDGVTRKKRWPPWSWITGGAFKSAISQLMDFSLLKNPVFLFVAVSNVFGMLGFYVPFVYLIDSAVKQNVDKDHAAYLISIIGITNTFGRVLCGVVSDHPKVNSLFLNNVCLLLSGICVGSVPFCFNFPAYVGVAIFFGLFVAGYISLTSIIIVDLLGLDNLTNAFGLLILFRGAASIIGAPLAGAVYDAFQSYDVPFFMAGGFLVLSSFISFMVPFVIRFAPPKVILEPRSNFVAVLPDIPEAAETPPNASSDMDSMEQDETRV